MNLQRKLTLAVVTGAVALGAGHFVQKKAAEREFASDEAPAVVVSSVTPVAAGPEDVAPKASQVQPPVLPAEAAPVAMQPAAEPAPAAGPAEAQLAAVEPEAGSLDEIAPVEAQPPMVAAPILAAPLVTVPEIAAPVIAAPVVTTEAPVAEAAVEEPVAVAPETTPALPGEAEMATPVADCPVQFDLMPQSDAMIGLSLLAPCHPDERVVLRHAGLAVTAKTSASGAMFATLPALTAMAEVEVAFADGSTVTDSLLITSLGGMQRFAVQWQNRDAFQLHAFENGASYDQPGHISAAFTGKSGETGLMHLLGDATTELPLLAEVYSFGPDQNAEVVIEAAVTEATCGRELLGETILAKNGAVRVTDLTLAMPDCEAIGDILVLKNPVQDMTLAAAN